MCIQLIKWPHRPLLVELHTAQAGRLKVESLGWRIPGLGVEGSGQGVFSKTTFPSCLEEQPGLCTFPLGEFAVLEVASVQLQPRQEVVEF